MIAWSVLPSSSGQREGIVNSQCLVLSCIQTHSKELPAFSVQRPSAFLWQWVPPAALMAEHQKKPELTVIANVVTYTQYITCSSWCEGGFSADIQGSSASCWIRSQTAPTSYRQNALRVHTFNTVCLISHSSTATYVRCTGKWGNQRSLLVKLMYLCALCVAFEGALGTPVQPRTLTSHLSSLRNTDSLSIPTSMLRQLQENMHAATQVWVHYGCSHKASASPYALMLVHASMRETHASSICLCERNESEMIQHLWGTIKRIVVEKNTLILLFKTPVMLLSFFPVLFLTELLRVHSV